MTKLAAQISDKTVKGLSRLSLSKMDKTLLEKELRAPDLDAVDIDINCFSESEEDKILTVIINCFGHRTKEILDQSEILRKVKAIFAMYVSTEIPLKFQIDRYS